MFVFEYFLRLFCDLENPILCVVLNCSSHRFRYRAHNQSLTLCLVYQGYHYHLSKCKCCHHLLLMFVYETNFKCINAQNDKPRIDTQKHQIFSHKVMIRS